MPPKYSPRLSVELSTEDYEELRRLVPWGFLKHIFVAIVKDVIRLLREHGHTFIGAVASRDLKLEDYMTVNTGEPDETGRSKEELLRTYLSRQNRTHKRNKKEKERSTKSK